MVQTAALVVTAFVAFQHLGFLVLEMFLWDHPIGHRVFRLDPEFARRSRALAANQGLYNGFLAAGLIWGLLGGGHRVTSFFLTCVIVAGIVGGITVKRSIIVIQALPAAAALLLHHL